MRAVFVGGCVILSALPLFALFSGAFDIPPFLPLTLPQAITFMACVGATILGLLATVRSLA